MGGNGLKTTLSLVPKRILIADDHLAVREGLRSLLEPESDFEIIGEAADGNEAAQKALDLKPDLIVLDNSMPGMTGLEVARILRANLPQTKIVFLTLDPGIRGLALATGAVAHIAKDQPPQEILRVVRAAAGLKPPQATAANGNEKASIVAASKKLGALLVDEKLLTAKQLDEIGRGRGPKQTLSNALLRAGLVPEEQLANAFAAVSGRRLVSLPAVDPSVARQLPRQFCEQRACVLMEFGRASAILAMADPLDEKAVFDAKDMLGGIELKVVTTTLTDVREGLKRAYAPTVVPLVTAALPKRRRNRRPLALLAAAAAVLLVAVSTAGVLLSRQAAVQARANLT